jgi:sortase A
VTKTPSTTTTPKRRRSRAGTALGLAFLLAGVGILAYVAWEFFGTDLVAKRAQKQNIETITEAWSKGTDPSQIKGIGLLRVPRFGKSYQMPILDGFDLKTLGRGVGRDPENAQPGEVGNLALAGHRFSRGGAFHSLPKLRQGDKVIVETRTQIFTYEMIEDGDAFRVDFTTSWPLWPVPDEAQSGATPTQAMLTLVTCAETFHSDWRYAARGVLVKTEAKTGTRTKQVEVPASKTTPKPKPKASH